jgi:hypothetical protein
MKYHISAASGQKNGQSDREKKLFWIHYKLWNADLVRHSIRTRPRARPRPRGRISTFDFEDEYDDEDDVN